MGNRLQLRALRMEVTALLKDKAIREVSSSVTRDFTVATFVVCAQHVLLLRHRSLEMWLPPGGHIEPHELPDDAAVREVLEESGVAIELVGQRGLSVSEPRQLLVPRGVQVERISPDHEHIDFVYFGVPTPDGVATSTDRDGTGDGQRAAYRERMLPALRRNDESTRVGWYDRDALREFDLTEEVRMWTERALTELDPIQ